MNTQAAAHNFKGKINTIHHKHCHDQQPNTLIKRVIVKASLLGLKHIPDPSSALPELCDLDFFFGQPVEESASSFSTGADLHLMRQKNARRDPGHSLVRPCGTSVFTGRSAEDVIRQV